MSPQEVTTSPAINKNNLPSPPSPLSSLERLEEEGREEGSQDSPSRAPSDEVDKRSLVQEGFSKPLSWAVNNSGVGGTGQGAGAETGEQQRASCPLLPASSRSPQHWPDSRWPAPGRQVPGVLNLRCVGPEDSSPSTEAQLRGEGTTPERS